MSLRRVVRLKMNFLKGTPGMSFLPTLGAGSSSRTAAAAVLIALFSGCAARAQDQPDPKAAAPKAEAAKAGSAATGELDPAMEKIRAGKLEEALELIKTQALKHPDWPPPRVLLARLLFAADQQQMGRRVLEQAAADSLDHPDVFLSLGTVALADGRLSDAQLNFIKARSLVVGGRFSEELAGRYQRESHEGLAAVAEGREDWKTAQAELLASLELEPKNGAIRQRLARMLFRQEKSDEAFAALEQAVKDAPQLEPAGVSMAWLWSQKGNTKKAEEWFAYAVKAEPQNPRPLLAQAAWLIDQGRSKDAAVSIDAAVKLDPKSREAQQMKGLIEWHARDLAAAEKTLEPVYHAQPANLIVANLFALTLIDQDDPVKRSRGLKIAETTARQNPRSSEALATVGWGCYRVGQVDQAEKILRASVSAARATPDVAYYLARVLVDKSYDQDALKLLESALKLPGAFAHRDDAAALLKTLKK